MESIEIENYSFTYPGEGKKALSGVTLNIKQGDFVVLCGPSGSGKTTLLRSLKREVSPAGTKSGSIKYGGVALPELEEALSAKEIGMVFQDPDNQIVMDTVIHELAFSLENFGISSAGITKRISEMVTFFGLEDCLHTPVHELSGGRKQIVNICSVLLLKPKVLLLDEPTSQLDPVAAHELIKILHQINQEFSMTVVISEHRLERLLPVADMAVYMEAGCIKYCGSPGKMSSEVFEAGDIRASRFLPAVTRLYFSICGGSGEDGIPLSVRDGIRFVRDSRIVFKDKAPSPERLKTAPGGENCTILSCSEVSYRYGREKPLVLKKLSMGVKKGEFLAILGGNGAGKTTLLQAMAGLIKPQQGHVYYNGDRLDRIESHVRYGKIGYVAQNPLLHFTFDTVDEELEHMAGRHKGDGTGRRLEELKELFELGELLSRHPYDLSGGQQQKLAIACALVSGPEILMIDEPTKGLDPVSKEVLAELLLKLRQTGLTIVMVTHDIEFAGSHAGKCALLFDGSITACSEPAAFFSDNYFYTTVINRVVREFLPSAITCEDVIEACDIQKN